MRRRQVLKAFSHPLRTAIQHATAPEEAHAGPISVEHCLLIYEVEGWQMMPLCKEISGQQEKTGSAADAEVST